MGGRLKSHAHTLGCTAVSEICLDPHKGSPRSGGWIGSARAGDQNHSSQEDVISHNQLSEVDLEVTKMWPGVFLQNGLPKRSRRSFQGWVAVGYEGATLLADVCVAGNRSRREAGNTTWCPFTNFFGGGFPYYNRLPEKGRAAASST